MLMQDFRTPIPITRANAYDLLSANISKCPNLRDIYNISESTICLKGKFDTYNVVIRQPDNCVSFIPNNSVGMIIFWCFITLVVGIYKAIKYALGASEREEMYSFVHETLTSQPYSTQYAPAPAFSQPTEIPPQVYANSEMGNPLFDTAETRLQQQVGYAPAFTASTTIATPQPYILSQPQPTIDTNATVFCHKCVIQAGAGSVFCHKCGTGLLVEKTI